MMRFKISLSDSLYAPFGLFQHIRKTWRSRVEWRLIETFKTHGEARAFYEKIKLLPTYLP